MCRRCGSAITWKADMRQPYRTHWLYVHRVMLINRFVGASGPSMIGSRGRSVCWTEGA